MADAVTRVKDLQKWDPIVLTFQYRYLACREPCLCPCCCCPCCFHPLSCCMSQKAKVQRIHDAIFENYARTGVFGKGAICVSFSIDEFEDGYRVTEIFRNIDAAEAYYDHFMKEKALMVKVLTNLPWRQAAGPEAVVMDGNVKCWGNPESLKQGPQTIKFNHLKLDTNPKGKVEVVEWKTLPSVPDLEQQFGALHYGFRRSASLVQPEGSEERKVPAQVAMR